mmetsp:Transcript_43672/g.48578  ORF Transcript_43672/g.48578 Transcript_43672/m.48578 type:complete len:389 (+) Transcript_43672:45-1211(+)
MTTTCPPNAIYFPVSTKDYYIKNDEKGMGFGLFASRNIKKGKLIFDDSIEFMFSDVAEGDYLLLQGHEEASKNSKSNVPATFPVTQEMLLHTHGVPFLVSSCVGHVIKWRLETPGMMMNHSCDPSVIDDSHDPNIGEGRASRNIKKGDALTYNYFTQYYDRGPFFDTCRCGSKNCHGSMKGFKALDEVDKVKYLPMASEAVQAMHMADIGKGPFPKEEKTVVIPYSRKTSGSDTKRLVFPGPSYSLASIEIKKDNNGIYAIFATKDFAVGERVYEYWKTDWPFDGQGPIDMIASVKLAEGDLAEGTTIHLVPNKCAAQKDCSGNYMFTGYDLLAQYSCEPNLTYNEEDEDSDDDDSDDDDDDDAWQGAYAVRSIMSGEKLTVDFNTRS